MSTEATEPIPRIALRPREAAESLGISERTLCDWTKRGIIPARKINGVVMYGVETLKDWMRKQTTEVSDN